MIVQWVDICAVVVGLKLHEVHDARPEASLGAEVIATDDADWFNASSSGAFLATLDLVDFALPNTATIPTSIDT